LFPPLIFLLHALDLKGLTSRLTAVRSHLCHVLNHFYNLTPSEHPWFSDPTASYIPFSCELPTFRFLSGKHRQSSCKKHQDRLPISSSGELRCFFASSFPSPPVRDRERAHIIDMKPPDRLLISQRWFSPTQGDSIFQNSPHAVIFSNFYEGIYPSATALYPMERVSTHLNCQSNKGCLPPANAHSFGIEDSAYVLLRPPGMRWEIIPHGQFRSILAAITLFPPV